MGLRTYGLLRMHNAASGFGSSGSLGCWVLGCRNVAGLAEIRACGLKDCTLKINLQPYRLKDCTLKINLQPYLTP